MKLLSTEIAENRIELTYADNPELDDASTLLIVRLPREVDPKKSVAWNRYWALDDLLNTVRKLQEVEFKTAEGTL